MGQGKCQIELKKTRGKVKKSRYTWFWLFLPVLLCACGKQPSQTVELNISHARKRALALFELKADQGAVLLDSLRPDKNGVCRFRVPCDSLRIYLLASSGNEHFLCLTPMPHQDLRISANYDSLVSSATVQPIPATDSLCPSLILLAYQQQIAQAERTIRFYTDIWMENRYQSTQVDSLHEACTRAIDSVMDTLRQEARRLCRQNTANLIPVVVINKAIGNRRVLDLSEPETLAFLLDCTKQMQRHNPQNPHVKRLMFQLARIDSYRKQEEIRLLEQTGEEPQIP